MKTDELKSLVVKPNATVLETMQIIDAGTVQVAFVVDDLGRCVGVMTDGDVRRCLLSGMSLNHEIRGSYSVEFKSVAEGTDRTVAIDMMLAYRIEQLPVINCDGQLCGVHLLTEILGADEKPNWAVVMAGGKGTRLGKLTQTIPKPMLNVAGRPILERIVLQLVGSGIRRIYLSVNYLSHMIEEHFKDGSAFGCEIFYLRESKPMGSGGSLALLPAIPMYPVVVMNGDVVTEFNLNEMIRFHNEKRAELTMAVKPYTHEMPYGCVTAVDGLVTKLEEKPVVRKTINAGIYIIGPNLLKVVPDDFYPITELATSALAANSNVAAYEINDWIDIGLPDQLAEARGEI